jgi:hypothetical protein
MGTTSMKHDNKIIRATKGQDVGELFMFTLLTTNFTVGKLWPGNSVLPTSKKLARIITLCYFYFRSLRSVNKFLFWAGYIRRRRDQPRDRVHTWGSDGVWQERSVDCSSGDGMRHFIVLCVLVVIGVQLARAAEDGLIESAEAREDIAPSTDPGFRFRTSPQSLLNFRMQRPATADFRFHLRRNRSLCWTNEIKRYTEKQLESTDRL